jgi:type VI secretion system secreted protein Hcp
MAMQLHMTIEGAKQGPIKGPSKIKGREDTFEVLAFNHEVTLPFESRTGAIAGKRVHHPMTTLKVVDDASPKLYKAISEGEHLKVEIKWYRPHPDGGAAEQHYFTTKLANAKLISIGPHMSNVNDKAQAGNGHLEQLSFVYDEITWTFAVSGVEHIDKWTEPA